MGLIHGAYDAKAEGFAPGGLSPAQSDERPRARRRQLAQGERGRAQAGRRSKARWRSWSRPAGPTARRNGRSTARSRTTTRPGPAFPRRSCRDRRQQRSRARQLGARARRAATFRSRTCRSASSRSASGGAAPGVAIGDYVLDLAGIADLLDEDWRDDLSQPVLNGWLARGPEAQRGASRCACSSCCPTSATATTSSRSWSARPRSGCTCPASIGDYTDFYVGIHHATNVGKQFRPDNPLLPNYKYVPIGYHGRASSVRASGEPVIRPNGQRKAPDADAPEYGPSRRLDYELELGHLGRPRATSSARRSRSARRPSISPAIACSTTGRRATSRRGNTSRSGRSSPRTS